MISSWDDNWPKATCACAQPTCAVSLLANMNVDTCDWMFLGRLFLFKVILLNYYL